MAKACAYFVINATAFVYLKCFIIFKGILGCSLQLQYLLFFVTIRLRGHSYKLYKPNSRLDIRKFSFSVRVINIWNALTYSVLQCNIQWQI